jgi:ribose 5-phosphate isomerase B
MVSETKRRIVTGEDVHHLPEGSLLDVPAGAILTDIAREWIEKKRIRVVETKQTRGSLERVRIAIGSDHGGFQMKEELKDYFGEAGISFLDYGTFSQDAVDYPDFAHAVSLAVALGHAKQGIVIDGAGIGSAIAANKVPGIRAGACYDESLARNAREHNDINVLTLGAKAVEPEKLRKIVAVFLTAEHTEARHRARVAKIEGIEKKYYRTI